MNYISTLLSILQEWDRNETVPIYGGKYIIQITASRTQRRLTVRETSGNNDEMIDMFVGSTVGVVKDAEVHGLQHYSRSHTSPIYGEWYQLFSPSPDITSVKYNLIDGFTQHELCVLDLSKEEDIFQKSTVVDVDMDVINSLILEHSQLPPCLSRSDNFLALLSGYEKIDFGVIIEGLQ